MDNSHDIKALLGKITTSLLKRGTPVGEEKSNTLTDADRADILFSIHDKSQIEERSQLTNKLNKQKAWETIIGSTKQAPKIKPTYWIYAAASIVILFGITFFLTKEGGQQNNKTTIVDSPIEIGTDKAVLTLEDGTDIILEKGTNYQTANVNSNGENIVYLATGKADKAEGQHGTENTYNYLTVPRGGQFHVQLADGTTVWLNSESQLKYPVAFRKGEPRHVELVYGEAYFDVSPSASHDGAVFKVKTQIQDLEVLGTKFNIKAYKSEKNIYTTLVEGKVILNVAGKKDYVVLAPNEQANVNLETSNIDVITVDVYNETSWIKGIFSFKDATLQEIMNVFSRWYDVDIIFIKEDLKNVPFDGVLGREEDLKDLLIIFTNANFINAYDIKDKTITIK